MLTNHIISHKNRSKTTYCSSISAISCECLKCHLGVIAVILSMLFFLSVSSNGFRGRSVYIFQSLWSNIVAQAATPAALDQVCSYYSICILEVSRDTALLHKCITKQLVWLKGSNMCNPLNTGDTFSEVGSLASTRANYYKDATMVTLENTEGSLFCQGKQSRSLLRSGIIRGASLP